MTIEGVGLRKEPTTIILLNELVLKLPSKLVLLSVLIRETSVHNGDN